MLSAYALSSKWHIQHCCLFILLKSAVWSECHCQSVVSLSLNVNMIFNTAVWIASQCWFRHSVLLSEYETYYYNMRVIFSTMVWSERYLTQLSRLYHCLSPDLIIFSVFVSVLFSIVWPEIWASVFNSNKAYWKWMGQGVVSMATRRVSRILRFFSCREPKPAFLIEVFIIVKTWQGKWKATIMVVHN